MYHYSVFGGRLRSELELPGLRPTAPAGHDWTFRCSDAPPPPAPEPATGSAAGPVTLGRTTGGWRLFHGFTGTYDVSVDGAEITWYPAPDAMRQYVGAVVLGPALALALHARGVPSLHGSAVAIGGRGIAFVAPKHHGKSTLALSLAARGARLVTDDTVAVDVATATVRPGVHCVRLWEDSLDALDAGGLCRTMVPGAKHSLADFEDRMLVDAPVPLDSIYVLRPVSPDSPGPAASRTLLQPMTATRALMQFTKLGPLLGPEDAGVLLEPISRLRQRVSVFALRIVGDFGRLDAAVEEIMSWHEWAEASA